MAEMPKLAVTFDDGSTVVAECTQGDLARFEQHYGATMANVDFSHAAALRLAYLSLNRMARKRQLQRAVPLDFEDFTDAVVRIEPLDTDPKAVPLSDQTVTSG